VVAGVLSVATNLNEGWNLISVYPAGGQKLNWARRLPGRDENPKGEIFGWAHPAGARDNQGTGADCPGFSGGKWWNG